MDSYVLLTAKKVSGKSRLAEGNVRVLLIQDIKVEGRRNGKYNLFNFTNIDSDLGEKP